MPLIKQIRCVLCLETNLYDAYERRRRFTNSNSQTLEGRRMLRSCYALSSQPVVALQESAPVKKKA